MTLESVLTKNQKIKTDWRVIEDKPKLRMQVEIRYDDECGNGHNTFSITAEIQEKRGQLWHEYSSGCLHEEIKENFPEYAYLIKWHLVSSDGPIHYVANTLYHASDKDHHGCRKGEPWAFSEKLRFKGFPITFKLDNAFRKFLGGLSKKNIQALTIEAVEHKPDPTYNWSPKYTFNGFVGEWYECPFDSLQEAEEFKAALQSHGFEILRVPTQFSQGKERELDAARSCALWPEATDQELMADDLKAKLEARLPGLLVDFQAAIKSLGFVY